MTKAKTRGRMGTLFLLCSVIAFAACTGTDAGTSSSDTRGASLSAETSQLDGALVVEGQTGWALVLAGAQQPFDALLEETVNIAANKGYETTATNCDQGAAEALQMDPDTTYTVSIHTDSKEKATTLLDEFSGIGIEGVVTRVTTGCPN